MRRVKVNWGGRGQVEYKCDSTALPANGQHVLLLHSVYSQDPGSHRLLTRTKMIPLDGVIEVDEDEW